MNEQPTDMIPAIKQMTWRINHRGTVEALPLASRCPEHYPPGHFAEVGGLNTVMDSAGRLTSGRQAGRWIGR